MRFLIDADLPRSLDSLIRSYGHEAVDVRDVGLGRAQDPQIASYALQGEFCILSGDWGFSDIRHYPPAQYAGIAILELPRDATATYIADLVESFLQEEAVLSLLKGRLAIVAAGKVRLRPR
jgi:hypothetical protein